METTTLTLLPPLPDAEGALSDALLLNHYFSLYFHYNYGDRLPKDFPIELLSNYPDDSCIVDLKNKIVNLSYLVNENLGIQLEYMREYNTLYMHYVGGYPLPHDFPECILEQFPNKSYKQALKTEIASLQYIINLEKRVV